MLTGRVEWILLKFERNFSILSRGTYLLIQLVRYPVASFLFSLLQPTKDTQEGGGGGLHCMIQPHYC